jgi:ABC-type multidrug transport system ATPase subunit
MKISLTNTGKRYNREWIFRGFNYEFENGKSYAITGPNGSGKSTLLQAIGGALLLSEGQVAYGNDQQEIAPEKAFQHLSIAAPYLELIEEMSVTEFLTFHQSFKPFLPGKTVASIIAEVGLEKAAAKQIRYYSSGMKQRVKLAQALFSDVSLILLDEPCTNLDKTGIQLYQGLVNQYRLGRTIIVSSNDEAEYGFCEQSVSILDYKTS